MNQNHSAADRGPSVYVGTYGKYNGGSTAGAWVDLEACGDAESFYEAARELHKDEPDPEFMFQDFEGFPRAYYSESSIPDELWDWIALDDDDRELLAVYQDGMSADATIGGAQEAFAGRFDSEADWAESFLNDTGGLEGVPEHLRNYIDFEAYGRDARLGGGMMFVYYNGELWAFHNH